MQVVISPIAKHCSPPRVVQAASVDFYDGTVHLFKVTDYSTGRKFNWVGLKLRDHNLVVR